MTILRHSQRINRPYAFATLYIWNGHRCDASEKNEFKMKQFVAIYCHQFEYPSLLLVLFITKMSCFLMIPFSILVFSHVSHSVVIVKIWLWKVVLITIMVNLWRGFNNHSRNASTHRIGMQRRLTLSILKQTKQNRTAPNGTGEQGDAHQPSTTKHSSSDKQRLQYQ